MKHIRILGLLISWPIIYINAQAPVEYRNLDGVNDPERWGPAECETSVSTRTAWKHPMVHMHIPVDYNAGEKAYPIGWPRMYLNLKPEEQGWKDYDRLEFQLYTESSRDELPKRPLNFHLYNKQGQKQFISMTSAAVGKSITFTLNISDIGVEGEITRLGFNINESDYADKDIIDFHIGGFRLARATKAQVAELKPTAPAIFCDSRVLPVDRLWWKVLPMILQRAFPCNSAKISKLLLERPYQLFADARRSTCLLKAPNLSLGHINLSHFLKRLHFEKRQGSLLPRHRGDRVKIKRQKNETGRKMNMSTCLLAK